MMLKEQAFANEFSNLFGSQTFIDQLKDKRVLLLVQDVVVYNKSSQQDMQMGAFFSTCLATLGIKCQVYIIEVSNYLEKSDEYKSGLIEDVAICYDEDSFDYVILLDYIENATQPLKTVQILKKVVKLNGNIILATRTPTNEIHSGLGSNIYFSEDIWRLDEIDIKNLFPDDKVTTLKKLENPENPSNGTNFLISEITLQTKDVTKSNVEIYNCRAGKRINIEDLAKYNGFFKQTELNKIGYEYRTDKSEFVHNYLNKYEFILSPLKNEEFTLMELGVFKGGSVKMWKEYFPRAQIIGCDVEEYCQRYAEPRIEIVNIDLSDVNNLSQLAKMYQPRVIIDDASHMWTHQILALSVLFPSLPSGGIYILEDLETSFYQFLNNASVSNHFADCKIDAYSFCEYINKVAVSKLKLEEIFDESPAKTWYLDGIMLEDAINTIGLQTEFVGIIKGSCIFIKR